MGVYIKGMEMPSGCLDCPLYNGYGCKATLQMFHPTTNVAVRVDSCPLTETQNGKWITDIYKLGKERHRCSECGKGSVEDSNFCPNCGARMKGADDERL